MERLKPEFHVEQILAFKCSLCDFLHLYKQGILDHACEYHHISENGLSTENLSPRTNENPSDSIGEMAVLCAKDIFSDCEIVQQLVDLTGSMELDQQLTAKNECITKDPVLKFVNTSSTVEDAATPSVANTDTNPERNASQSKPYPKRCAVNKCGFKFVSEANLTYHRRCHDQESSDFTCPECRITHPQWKTLSLHLWKSHGLDIELYSCDVCPYKTHSYSTLINIHRRIHSDDRPFLCDICGKGFKTGKQLRNHRVIHPEIKPSADVEVVCDICHYKCADKYRLQKHKNRVHLKVRPYLCNFCGFTTSSRSALKMHLLRQHTGEKPFSCDTCGYQTNDHNSLRRHKMRHSGEKRYKCPACSYSCIQSSSYKTHLNSKHPSLYQSLAFRCPSCPFQCLQEHKLRQHQLTHPESGEPQLIETSTAESRSGGA